LTGGCVGQRRRRRPPAIARRFMQADKGRRRVRETAGLFGAAPSGPCCRRAKRGGSERKRLRGARLIRLIRETQCFPQPLWQPTGAGSGRARGKLSD
jgi:hypothetical protein